MCEEEPSFRREPSEILTELFESFKDHYSKKELK
tara:strand:+ start:666 stop:767 length:102 start_codon:yes stop_codon:yes gene_type:complete